MFLFKNKKQKEVDEIIVKVDKRDLLKRYLYLIIGCFIVAFAFNLFLLKYNIVCFGVSGLSIVFSRFGINPSFFIMTCNIILLIISFFTLGWKKTKKSIVGSIIFPLFTYLTAFITNLINLSGAELIIIVIFGAVLTGFGCGLIFKTGFTTGGTDIINQIINKYVKISLGKAILIVDGIILLIGKLVFSFEQMMYGIIVLYIISILTDKVVLGISESKIFYIVTTKEEQIKEFLLSITGSGVTLIDAKGGYTDKNKTVFMCAISTKQYFIVKEGLTEIDPDVFFLVTDAYEVNRRNNHALISKEN